ncbi:MAG: hypothetical protein HRU12_10090 [Phaeodactylibacter sp.]|nr:hypothetical protein [Phaeodactylibacter sp.]
MYQFDAGGPATGLSQSMAGILDARQLEWMSPHFYVLDFTSGLVIQMNSSGVATGVDFSGMGGVTTGVTVDGTHIYTSGADGFTKYDDAGLLVQYYPRDITPLGYIGSNLIFDGKDFWSGGTVLYGLDTDFKLTGEVINRPNSNHNGATYVQSTDRMLWCDTTQDVVYEYELENYVGYATALTNDNHTGFPFYVKVG